MSKIPEDLFPKDERIFLSSVYEKITNAENKGFPAFCDFCRDTEMAFLKGLLSSVGGFGFVSKIKDAERQIPAVNYEYASVPTDIILFEGISGSDVSHRDILGSLMNLGIKRQKIGDILTDERVFAEVKSEITPYILSTLGKIRNRNVNPVIYDGEVVKTFRFEECFYTVSSLRADCIVGAVLKMSRETAKNTVLSGQLLINSLPMEKPDEILKENDVMTVKGSGKFIFSEILGNTKKDRVKILIKKYI